MADDRQSSKPGAVVVAVIVAILVSTASGATGASTLDNVAVQWNYLFNVLHCRSSGLLVEPKFEFAQLHLAQWHALLALKHVTGSEESQDLVVAFASHTVLANYFPNEKTTVIDLLLDTQLNSLDASTAQETLGRRLGEAAAISLIQKRRAGREFSLRALKSALNSDEKNSRPGLYRYLNNTPAGRAAATFVFYDLPIARPYVVPEPRRFIKTYLTNIKPPIVPSTEWDQAYASIVDAGSADNPNRTADMNFTASLAGCFKVNSSSCYSQSIWSSMVRSSLPESLSLYDTVEIFAKLAVTMHDALLVLTALQYGFWFWRPIMATRAGDARHEPIPNWTPYLGTPPHPEYPSGTVTVYSAAATVMETFFKELKMQPNVIKISEGGRFGVTCPLSGQPVNDKEFKSFADVVAFAQNARIWAGAHYNKSVVDAVEVGSTVAKYVAQHWDEPMTPSGVLPDPTYLTVVAELPKKQAEWSPLRLEY